LEHEEGDKANVRSKAEEIGFGTEQDNDRHAFLCRIYRKHHSSIETLRYIHVTITDSLDKKSAGASQGQSKLK